MKTLNALLAREKIRPPLTGAELKRITDPRRAVGERRSEGGPSPQDTASQSRELQKLAREARRWVSARRASLDRARKKLDATIRALTTKKKKR